MVKVTFRPWEEVVIHEDIFYSFDDLVKLSSLGVQPGGLARPLKWAQGVLFRHQGMPPTDDIVKEQLEGKVHWNSVEWALMPRYEKVIMIHDINAKIPVIDASANKILSDVAIALKKKGSR
jgi:hypothetical protein